MIRSSIFALALLIAPFAVRSVTAERLTLFDGDFPDASWTHDDDGGQVQVLRVATDGNPGAYRELRVLSGGGGQMRIVNHNPQFLFDPATQGTLTGLSISFDAIRLDAGVDPFYVSVGIFQNDSFQVGLGGVTGVGWQHHEFECIVVSDFELDDSPLEFAFAFDGFTPFGQLASPYVIGIDNFLVQVETAPDLCDGFSGPLLQITSTDNGHQWNQDPVIPYVITVTNAGSGTATDVHVSDRVPAMTTFETPASSAGWACAPGDVADVCTVAVGDLAPGESRSVTFAARVVDGTDPLWNVFNEARTNPCTTTCTKWGPGCDFDQNPLGCCAADILCEFDDDYCIPDQCETQSTVCIPATTPSPSSTAVRAAGSAPSDDRVSRVLLYQLRDRHLQGTDGGRRATTLYYRHSAAMGATLIADPALAQLAVTALRSWQPAIRALIARTPFIVSAAQLQALAAFLDALRAAATGPLAGGIDRGRARLALETWEGITIDEALDRLDALVCTVAASYDSVVCRLGDAVELIETDIPEGGALTAKLLTTLGKAATLASEAETATADGDRRGARKRARKAAGLAKKVSKRARSRRGRREIPEAVRTELGTSLDAIRADLKALLRA